MAGRRSTGATPDAVPWGGPPSGARPGDGDPQAGDEARPAVEGARPAVEGAWRAGDEVGGVRLEAVVGRGGSGEVWSGTETATGLRVAVKLLRPATDGSSSRDGDSTREGDGDRARLRREAALLEGLRHPHLLPLRRVVLDPPAVVTELAAGGSLTAQVAARGSLEPGEVVTVLAPLADALATLHARGVVHGDVTGTNVLFVDRGRPVLADLGSAGLVGDGVGWATPGYAAPEVLAGARPGPAADVHGLAAAGWLALTGAVPPAEEDRLPLRLLAPGCPDALVDAVAAGLDPDPERRPAPEDLAATVRSACPGLPVRLVPSAALGVRPEEAVTYRVREAAAADPVRPEDRWWRAAARWRARGRGLDALPERGARSGPWGRSGAVLLLVVAVTAGAVVVVGDGRVSGGGAVGGEAGAGVGVGSGPSGAGPSTAEPTPLPTTAEPTPLPPTPRAEEVVALVDARGQALRAGDVDALGRVHAPGSDALAADQRLARGGPLEVGYEVLAVEPAPASRPGPVDGEAAVRVRLRTTTAGTSVTEEVGLTLARTADGWRVRAVTG